MAEISDLGSKRAEKALKEGGEASVGDMLDMAKSRIERLGKKKIKLLKIIWVTDDDDCKCKDMTTCDHGFVVLTRDKCSGLERFGAYDVIRDYFNSDD